MSKNHNHLRTWLAAFLVAFAALLFVIVPMSALVASPQGKGGEVVAKPTPTPRKTTPKRSPPSRTNNSKTNQTTKSAGEAASAAEMIFWNSIKDSTNPDEFRAYLKKYPSGEFADIARSRLNALEAAAKEDAARKEEAKKAEGRRKEIEALKRPGAVVKNQMGMEFAYVPAGTFMMGSERYDNEKPIHQVVIRDGFYIGRYEVTQVQWQEVMGTNPSMWMWKDCIQCPVSYVSWNDAQAFIRKLNARADGFTYRLPTESEWEYACRSGTTTAFAFGDSIASAQANFDGSGIDAPYGGSANGVNRKRTVPVGSFQPNAWGLYDMHGNVMEWCEDVWHENYNLAPADGSAWISGGDQMIRVLRGGAWSSYASALRSSDRNRYLSDQPNESYGCRIVAVPRTQ
jgi:formylglycine-generating enzyme required for sulfatase activity